MDIDEAIKLAKAEVDKMEWSNYKGMSIVQIETIYQHLTDLLWMKMQSLINNKKNGKEEGRNPGTQE